MTSLWSRDPLKACGLVVVFPEDDVTMWSSEVTTLVEQVEEQVKGSFVTFALLNGRQPSLTDAVLAARFSGCTSLTLVVLGGRDGNILEALPTDGRGEMAAVVTGCRRDPSAVARTYLRSLFARPAACA